MTVADGGPAFPCDVFDPDVRGPEQWEGMTLRDYFAGQALPMLIDLLRAFRRDQTSYVDVDHCAKQAYAMADAMLKARQS